MSLSSSVAVALRAKACGLACGCLRRVPATQRWRAFRPSKPQGFGSLYLKKRVFSSPFLRKSPFGAPRAGTRARNPHSVCTLWRTDFRKREYRACMLFGKSRRMYICFHPRGCGGAIRGSKNRTLRRAGTNNGKKGGRPQWKKRGWLRAKAPSMRTATPSRFLGSR